jgi:hypothetical protein
MPTKREAENDWAKLLQYCKQKELLFQPSEDYHTVHIFDFLTGEFTRRLVPRLIAKDPLLRIKFWHNKFKDYRLTGDDELISFLIERIQAARRGQA